MSDGERVWYASYGSNLAAERFACYIRGGRPTGGRASHPGCADQTPPREDCGLWFPHRLYFAMESPQWTGGVAFVETTPEPGAAVFCRLYNITWQQFLDVYGQENCDQSGLPAVVTPTCAEVRHARQLRPFDGTWYGTMLYLGEHQDLPVVTFTSATSRSPKPPSEAYLRTITKGLLQIEGDWQKAPDSMLQYLSSATAETWSVAALRSLWNELRAS